MKVRIAGIVRESIVDGPGIRFAVFTQGCPHNCVGCHNPNTHDCAGGKLVNTEDIMAEFVKNPYLAGITLSGGEPLLQVNAMLDIAKKVTELGKNIVIFTGYTFEELLDRFEKEPNLRALLLLCDILVDGKFVLERRDLSLPLAGSSNQRMINSKKSVEQKQMLLYSLPL